MLKHVLRFILILVCCLSVSCSTIEKNNKKTADLKMQVAVSYLSANNLPLALKELLEAAELDPSNPYIQNNLGIVYFMREKYELANKYFLRALDLDSRFTDARNNLARLMIEQKQYSKAQKILDTVLSDLTYTNTFSAYFNYGLSWFNQNQFSKAKDYFEKALNENRTDCYSQVYYGRTLLELKTLNEASQQLDQATHFCGSENVDEAHFYSAIAYYRLGLTEKSTARFEELQKIFPNGKNFKKSTQMLELIKKGVK
jgi:type IV pilus assembly protein PilF